MARQLATAAINVARDAHYELNPVTGLYERTLLLEGAQTNVVKHSGQFDNAAWAKSAGITVTADATVAPDGATTAELVDSTGAAPSMAVSQAIPPATFASDGTKVFSFFARKNTAATTSALVFDSTFSVSRRSINVAWGADGSPTVTNGVGTGANYPAVALGNGWYRISFSADGVVAASAHLFLIYPASQSAIAGSTYLWGAQAEDATFPSSHIPTTTAAVTRAADSLSFPFTLPPQEMTVYAKFIERGLGHVATSTGGLLHIGSAAVGALPRLIIYNRLGAGRYTAYLQTPSGTTLSDAPGTSLTAIGDTVEIRATMSAAGEMTIHISINGGVEASGPISATNTLPGAWAGSLLWLGVPTSMNGAAAFQSVKVARGTKTLAEMRAL